MFSYLKDIFVSSHRSSFNISLLVRTTWVLPPPRFIKLNIDHAFRKGKWDGGGLLRNCLGHI